MCTFSAIQTQIKKLIVLIADIQVMNFSQLEFLTEFSLSGSESICIRLADEIL